MKRILMPFFASAVIFLGTGVLFNIPLQIGSPAAAQPKHGQGAADAVDALVSLSERFESVAAKVLPAVVSVEAIKPPRAGGSKQEGVEESGSGVIVKSDVKAGYFVITNNHVVSQAKNEQITIQLPDGRVFRPTAVQADP